MEAATKLRQYEAAIQRLEALLAGCADDTAAMASVVAVLWEELESVSWVGFYRVVEKDLLRVGPYQGPVGCLEIQFGKGVCGTAAATLESQVVPDVHAFPGHIACDAESRSEIVVPVRGASGQLAAVLDLDSHQAARFDLDDKRQLERIAILLRPLLATG